MIALSLVSMTYVTRTVVGCHVFVVNFVLYGTCISLKSKYHCVLKSHIYLIYCFIALRKLMFIFVLLHVFVITVQVHSAKDILEMPV